ncbi:MAG: hypothetical protein IJY40_11050 [Oscillospiraceae bacterium]|nr:hypothetical protein [Oscillospiraceae bacterium]
METWQYLPAGLLLATLLLVLRSSTRRKRRSKEHDFDRKLETVLQARETVKLVCPSRSGRWVLTSKRLLGETRTGFTAVALKDIKRVQGNTKEGKTTASIPKMVSLTVKAEQDHTIYNSAEEFAELAKLLQDKVKKQNEKKKKKKTEKK